MALSKKYRDFVDAYMETGNASEAARRSGYNGKRPDQAGYEYLRKPEVAEEIRSRTALIMPPHEVMQYFAARARSSIANVLRLPFIGPMPEDQPPQAIDNWAIDLIKAQQTGAIHQIKKIKSGRWGPEIEMYDPLAAQELVAKYHGMLVERTEVTGAEGAPLFPDFEKALQKTYADADEKPVE